MKTETETKGSVIYTPLGYGIIQDIKNEEKAVTVKVNNTVKDFKRSEVSFEIPLSLTFLSSAAKFETTAYFPIHMTITELLTKIEEMEVGGQMVTAKRVFHNGKELGQNPMSLEKFGLLPETKLLVIMTLGKPYTINRFASITSSWNYGSNSIDGITFTVNKDIRVIGFGLYVPNAPDKFLPGVYKFLQGNDAKGTPILTKEVNLSQGMPDVTEKVYRAMFDKPVPVKAGQQYSCVCELKNGTSFYGSSGKTTVTGDKDVTFTFSSCTGSANGTGTGSGQMPEIYYYA
mmetsp:Transcript_3592/g.3947  ORF Transcript_3592/g.3947 Transcript_3592/m.3947 type:complete len:288 (-) Transcript_3592:61-924(-)